MSAFTLNSQSHATQSNIKSLFDFLSDFKNFKEVLPEDKVENFEWTENQCSFNIRGITPMSVRLQEKTPYTTLLFSSEGLAKFNFSLKVNLSGSASELGHCSVDLSGNLNPIIRNMAEKSLLALVNTMSLKLSQLKL